MSQEVLSFETFFKSIMKVYRLEKILSQSDERKRKLFTEKNGKEFCTIRKILRKYEMSFF